MIEVKAYKCSWCNRCFLRPCNAAQHEARCLDNPATRACKTCRHSVLRTILIGDYELTTYCCDVHDMPLSDNPYYAECDHTYSYGAPSQPIPFTCEHYKYRNEQEVAK